MARDFNGTSDYLEHGAAVVGAVPITLACWFNADTLTAAASRVLIAIGDAAADTKVFVFLSVTGKLTAQTTNVAGTGGSAASTVDHTAGVWNHGVGVFASSTDRRAFINGAKTTNTTSIVLGTPTVSSIGIRYAAGVRGSYMVGLIAETAIWNVALDDEEVSILGLGYSPLLVRPTSLQAYWPLIGRYSPEIDVRGGFNSTVTGTAVADHPRIIYKRRHRSVVLPAFVPFQYARPDSDITEGGWLPSSGGSLYAVVDELVADDADRMRSNTGSAADAVTLGLSDITTPDAGTVDITIRHRIGT